MLTLITATPGSGKTLKCIEIIFDLLNKGYVVYANIIGLKIPGVLHISTNEDWRLLDHFKTKQPDLSDKPIAVFYDECHEHPAFAKENLIPDKKKMDECRDIGRALAMHRQFGFDIYLITQFPNDLAPFVLGRVGRHLFLRRVFSMYRATIYEYPEAHTSFPKSVRQDAVNKTIWKFPKHLYDFYTSTELDTHKRGIPFKYIAILILIFIVLPSYVFLKFKDDKILNSENSMSNQQEKTPQKPLIPMPEKAVENKSDSLNLEQQELSRIAMVIESDTDCYAKNSYGDIIEMPQDRCRYLSKNSNRIPLSKMDKTLVHSHSAQPNQLHDLEQSTSNDTVPVNNYINPAFTKLTN